MTIRELDLFLSAPCDVTRLVIQNIHQPSQPLLLWVWKVSPEQNAQQISVSVTAVRLLRYTPHNFCCPHFCAGWLSRLARTSKQSRDVWFCSCLTTFLFSKEKKYVTEFLELYSSFFFSIVEKSYNIIKWPVVVQVFFLFVLYSLPYSFFPSATSSTLALQ